ncbi:hypothetical protein HanRHA438_Chr04g0198151 [Helianthus annuus]|nr:hypothetical protein HanRHA438_Chr04g0198151 [Helianthus annuus]
MRKFISLVRKRHIRYDWGLCRSKKKAFMVVVCTLMLYITYRTANFQPSLTKVFPLSYTGLKGLPYGIIEDKSDFELKPIWQQLIQN